MNFLTPKTQETAYYTAVSAKLLKSYFSRWPMAAILDFCQLRLMPTLLRGTPPPVSFIEDKNTKKRTFALLGHGSAPDDQTKSPYLCNHLTDFDEVWHDDAHSLPTGDRPLKFQIFENSRWRRPPS